jgi:hypothetical protein
VGKNKWVVSMFGDLKMADNYLQLICFRKNKK